MTEAGPRNGSFEQGSEATLFCRVKSLVPPHVQWLKKLDPTTDQAAEDQVRLVFRVRILQLLEPIIYKCI